MTPSIHIIAGATASGKSARAMQLARETGGVIINADSQQLYQELRILTARPSEADEAELPHRLYGALAGDDPASVGKWLKLVKMEIDWVLSEEKKAIVVGGTGMYLKALMEGMANIPEIDPSVTAAAASDLRSMGPGDFRERLMAVDPIVARRLPPGDTQRLVRAWAVWMGTGKPLSFWQTQGNQALYQPSMFHFEMLELERQTLYERSDARVVQMFEQGAVAEVEALLAYSYEDTLPIMRVIGVPQIKAMLAGEVNEADTIAAIQQSTRHFVKRQLTWFRNQL